LDKVQSISSSKKIYSKNIFVKHVQQNTCNLDGPYLMEGHSTATSFGNIPENELLLCCNMCLMQQEDKCGYNMMECQTHYFNIFVREARNKAAAGRVHNPIQCCHNKRNGSHSETPLNGQQACPHKMLTPKILFSCKCFSH